jgi:hypothetical protein
VRCRKARDSDGTPPAGSLRGQAAQTTPFCTDAACARRVRHQVQRARNSIFIDKPVVPAQAGIHTDDAKSRD